MILETWNIINVGDNEQAPMGRLGSDNPSSNSEKRGPRYTLTIDALHE
jgi:hypothetical protein